MSAPLSCSFCGKRQQEVGKLVAGQHIAGIRVCICDECIFGCLPLIATGLSPDAVVARLDLAIRDAVQAAVDRIRAQLVPAAEPGGS